jgi:hypothetical protein
MTVLRVRPRVNSTPSHDIDNIKTFVAWTDQPLTTERPRPSMTTLSRMIPKMQAAQTACWIVVNSIRRTFRHNRAVQLLKLFLFTGVLVITILLCPNFTEA